MKVTLTQPWRGYQAGATVNMDRYTARDLLTRGFATRPAPPAKQPAVKPPRAPRVVEVPAEQPVDAPVEPPPSPVAAVRQGLRKAFQRDEPAEAS